MGVNWRPLKITLNIYAGQPWPPAAAESFANTVGIPDWRVDPGEPRRLVAEVVIDSDRPTPEEGGRQWIDLNIPDSYRAALQINFHAEWTKEVPHHRR